MYNVSSPVYKGQLELVLAFDTSSPPPPPPPPRQLLRYVGTLFYRNSWTCTGCAVHGLCSARVIKSRCNYCIPSSCGWWPNDYIKFIFHSDVQFIINFILHLGCRLFMEITLCWTDCSCTLRCMPPSIGSCLPIECELHV